MVSKTTYYKHQFWQHKKMNTNDKEENHKNLTLFLIKPTYKINCIPILKLKF